MTLIKLSPPNKTLRGHKLVLADPRALPKDALDRLHTRFPDLKVQHYDADATDPWADATLALGTTFDLPSVEQAKKLELFQLTSAGADGLVGKPIFDDTKISFCTASGVHGPQISEWVVSTFLAFQHRLPEYLENQHQRKWQPSKTPTDDSVGQRVQVLLLSPPSQPSFPLTTPLLRGILGYGSVGRQVARLCKAMGMLVHAYTLHPRRTPSSRRDDSYAPPGLGDPSGALPDRWFAGGSTAELHAFLGSGLDLLVVALPLTPQTRGLVAQAEFEVLRANKTFVSNIGRGPIVDTEDLVTALERGVIRGAALDVTDPEPLPEDHPLWRAKNVIITPHVSGGSSKYMERVFEVLLVNLTRFSNGERLMNLINRKEGY
ncbi:NAD(P)-binding domain protein [Beauveria brongniartii RCEF 3172]|uniref:NAD(P)-binding domain protein n=1 Tax=Beauveria brongniartii RCEF 3172 TaxID=1081107 RepID=A0A166ZTC7_9HYPO|nr:NAD(P)-binding domain protein [Beauveria brongniartii RCEF 3172]